MSSRILARPSRVAFASLALLSVAVQARAESAAGPNALNPELAVDSMFSLSQFSRDNPLVFDGGHDPHQSGFNLQQVELTFGANVDPYFRADSAIVLTSEGIEIEEAYATSLAFPANLQLKAGQFLTAFGRNNTQHPHAWDFADKPLVIGRFFGGDGLRNPGAQLSWLTPLPWFSELVVSGQNSNGETATSFNPDGKMRSVTDAIAMVRWANFFSVSDDLSVNLGGSFLSGPNATGPGSRTRILGGDLYVKYRQPDSLSFVALTVEALRRTYHTTDGDPSDWGWYAQLNYRLPAGMERWHVGLRYDWASAKGAVPVITSKGKDDTGADIDLDVAKRTRISPVVTFYPSEFSKVRFQYNYDKPEDFLEAQHVAHVQFEFLIGAHGAHKF